MKYLYVLVSSDKDFYYEQALMSIYSLKNKMPQASVSLLVDDRTAESLKGLRSAILDFVDELKVEKIAENQSAMFRSRYLKTQMRNLIKGDFLYVDVDTVWCEAVDEHDFTDDVMAVPDGHCLLKDHPMEFFIKGSLDCCGYTPSFPYHINSGVIFMKDSELACELCLCWHRLWKESVAKKIMIDQASLNQANHLLNNPVKLLPGCYNAQILRSVNELSAAKVIHYFSSWSNEKKFSPAYKLLQPSFLTKVKENGLTPEIIEVLDAPKQAFDNQIFIVNAKVNGLWQSEFGKRMSFMVDSENVSERCVCGLIIRLDMCFVKLFYKIAKLFELFKKRK